MDDQENLVPSELEEKLDQLDSQDQKEPEVSLALMENQDSLANQEPL